MPTPNRLDVVKNVDRLNPALLRENSKASATAFRQLVAATLYRQDGNWGELTKRPGENQSHDGRAVDAVIYRPEMQVVDIISDAGSGKPTVPAWSETVRRQGNDWAVPSLIVPVVFQPPVEPEPPVVTPPPVDPRIEQLQGEQRLTARLLADVALALDRAVARIAALEKAEYRVQGQTSRWIGHAHSVDLPVVRRT
jgi:hypothetical protein